MDAALVPAPTAAAAAGGTPGGAAVAATSLSALLKHRAHERALEKRAISAHVEAAAEAASEIENDVQVCVGIEASTMVQNQRHLEAAVKALRVDVRDIAKRTAKYGESYAALVCSVSEVGSLAAWLQHSEAMLETAGGDMGAIERLLTQDLG